MNWQPTEYRTEGGWQVYLCDGKWKLCRYLGDQSATFWLKQDGTWGEADDDHPDRLFDNAQDAMAHVKDFEGVR